MFPTPGHGSVSPRRAQLDPDRHRGRLPAGTGGCADSQPITWITDPTASTSATSTSTPCCWRRPSGPTSIVDFSEFAGKTLILYNDAPAAFPARVPRYDYYTGGPDLTPVGAPTTLPGYGPNTRTVMQIKVVQPRSRAGVQPDRAQ